METWHLKQCHKALQQHHHQLQLVLVSALYVLTLFALSSIPEQTLDAFHQLHHLATCIAVSSPSMRLPILGPLRIEHADAQNITGIMSRAIKFLQDHSLMNDGEPWVKAVGTVALRQVRNPNLQTSIYSQYCNWTAQDVKDREINQSIVPPAWKHSPSVGLPPMQASWCTVPDGGYYLGLRLEDIANHELCENVPIDEVNKCVNELLSSIMEEFDSAGWIDYLTSTVTISLTMFDFRHGLACIFTVVGEKLTITSWNVNVRIFLVYPREYKLTVWTLMVLLLITGLDLLCSQCIRLKKRILLVIIDVMLLLIIWVRLAMHFSEARLLRSATIKFLGEVRNQPRRSDVDPYGFYEGIEPLGKVEQRISTLETMWMLGVLLKVLSLEWYGTRGATFFILIFRRALRKSFSLVFTIAILIVVHALAFYRFLGKHLVEFEFFDNAFSTMVGYTVGIFKHEVFFLKSFTWKVLFLLSAFTLFLLGSQYVLTIFLSTIEAMNEISDVEVKEGKSDVSDDGEDLDDKIFLRIVKEELERALANRGQATASTTSSA